MTFHSYDTVKDPARVAKLIDAAFPNLDIQTMVEGAAFWEKYDCAQPGAIGRWKEVLNLLGTYQQERTHGPSGARIL